MDRKKKRSKKGRTPEYMEKVYERNLPGALEDSLYRTVNVNRSIIPIIDPTGC